MESPWRVRVVSECLVKPASPAPQRTLFLSALDIMCRRVPYNRRVLFYQVADEEYAPMVARLKESLARVLAHFYPLAGRLSCRPSQKTCRRRSLERELEGEEREREGEGEDDERAHVDCNDMGAEFVEAELISLNHQEFEEGEGGEYIAAADDHRDLFEGMASAGFPMRPFFRDLTRWASYSMQDHEGIAPLLSIQITRFKYGGISLGVAYSHAIADGYSLWHFMTAWAECARGECISLPPVHTRTLMKIKQPSKEKAFWDMEQIKDDPHCQLYNKNKVQKSFDFKKEIINSLKEKVDGNFSSYEVLSAHIWKCTSKARAHAPDIKVGFFNIVNMRMKMEPPMPVGYFGNCIAWGVATAKARELEEEDLSTTALRIKTALNTCTHSKLLSMLHLLELYGPEAMFEARFFNPSSLYSTHIHVSSSLKFPTFLVDFGWGKPLAARPTEVAPNGKLILFPGHEGLGSASICIALHQDVMERLEQDPNFLQSLS